MSDSEGESEKITKRLVPKNSSTKKLDIEPVPIVKKKSSKSMLKVEKGELSISTYTEKSFVVMGATAVHAKAMTELGGKYMYLKNLYGEYWLFAEFRRPSVEHYLKTGSITKAAYSGENKYTAKKSSNEDPLIRAFLKELYSAFDKDSDYDGATIHETIAKFEKKYCPSKPATKNTPKQSRTTALDSESEDEK